MPPNRPSFLRRLGRLLLLGAAGLVLLLVSAWLLRGPLFARRVAELIASELALQTGGRYTVEEVGGTWLGDVELRGLRMVEPPETGALRGLHAERVVLEFDLFELPSDVLRSFRDLRIEGLEVELDFARADEEPPGEDVPGPPLREILDAVPDPLPDLHVEGRVAVVFHHGDARIDRVLVAGGGREIRLSLRGIHVPEPWGARDVEPVEAVIRRPTGRRLEWASETSAGGVTVREGKVLTDEQDAWSIEARLETAGGSTRVAIGGERLVFETDALDFAELPGWVPVVLGVEEQVPSAGRLSAEGEIALGTERFEARGRIAGADLVWDGFLVAELVAEGGWAGDAGRVETLDVVTSEAVLRGAGLAIEPSSPLLFTRVDRLEAEVPDLARLLAALPVDVGDAGLPPGPVALHARVRRDAEGTRIEELRAEWAGSQVRVEGTARLPAEPARWRETRIDLAFAAAVRLERLPELLPGARLPEAQGRVTADGTAAGTLAEPDLRLDVAGADLSVEGRAVRELSARAELRWPLLVVERLVVASDLGDLEASGRGDLREERVLEARFALDVPDLAAVARVIPGAPDMAGSLVAAGTLEGGAAEGEGAPDDLLGRLLRGLTGGADVEGQGLTIGAADLGRLSFRSTLAWPALRVEELTLDGPSLALDVEGGAADLAGSVVHADRFAVVVRDLSALRGSVPDLPFLAGSLRAAGTLDRLDLHEPLRPAGAADVDGEDLVLEDGTQIALFEAVVVGSGDALVVERLHAVGPWGTADAAGSVVLEPGGGRAVIDAADFSRRGHGARLAGPATVAWSPGVLTVEDLDVAAFGGRVRGGVHLAELLDAELLLEDVDLAAFSAEIAGSVSGRIHATGAAERPDLSADLRVPDLEFRGRRGEAVLALRQDRDGLHLDDLRIDAGDLAQVRGRGVLPLRLGTDGLARAAAGEPDLELEVRIVDVRPWLDLAGVGDVEVAAVQASVVARGELLLVDAVLTEVRWIARSVEPDVEAREVRVPGEVRLVAESGPLGTRAELRAGDGGPFRFHGTLRSEAAFDWTRPAEFPDALADARLEADLEAVVPDLAVLGPLLGTDAALAGRLRAGLVVRGTGRAPEMSGTAVVEDAAFDANEDLPPLDRVNARLRLAGRTIEVERLDGRLGYAPFRADGAVQFPRGGPPELDLRLVGSNLLVTRSAYLRLRADVDVEITGPFDGALVAGRVDVTNGLYTRPMDLGAGGAPAADEAFQVFALRDAPLSQLRFDLRVTADDTFLIENDLVFGRFSADLRLSGTGAVPRPDGRVFAGDDVTVYLPFTELDVERGVIAFSAARPFSPEVQAVATTSLKGYELYVSLSGRLPDPEVLVSSNPSLGHQDAMLLLATGATPGELEREGVAGTALARAQTLVGAEIFELFTGEPRRGDEGFFSRFEVEIGREATQSGSSTIHAEFELSERWYLRAERDRYDHYNAGIVWRLRFR